MSRQHGQGIDPALNLGRWKPLPGLVGWAIRSYDPLQVVSYRMRYIQILIALLLCGCVAHVEVGTRAVFAADRQSTANPASLLALFGQPASYNGKLVRVSGFLSADREGSYLFLTKDLCARDAPMDGLGVGFAEDLSPDWRALGSSDCREVLVEGIFQYFPPQEPVPNSWTIRPAHGAISPATYLVTVDDES